MKLTHLEYFYHLFKKRCMVEQRIFLQCAEHGEARWLFIKEVFGVPLVPGVREVLEFDLAALK